jgi:tetratricopeptide (TPR) repeat protein
VPQEFPAAIETFKQFGASYPGIPNKIRRYHRMLNSRSAKMLSIVLFLTGTLSLSAQDPNPHEMRLKVETLFEQNNKVGAIPTLEKLLVLDPDDPDLLVMMGEALIAKTVHADTAEERRALRKRSREMFVKARENGANSGYVSAMIASMEPDGGGDPKYSSVPLSDAATLKGEQAFTAGKIDEALDHYKRALELDPKNYFAALFAGDMYLKKDDYPNAEVWYQKAIAIDPFIETAYRYSATPLMRQKKYDQARNRYIEAWITAPFNRFAVNGMIMWAQATNRELSHPRIEPPKTEVGEDGKPKTTININPLADDGSMAWIAYTASGETWKKDKFRKAFPNETTYRRSLAEEADALRSVVSMAKTLKPKKLNAQIAMIEKLDKDGLLEAFILMSVNNAEVHKDHRAYLISNREKLRQYVLKYVIQK